MTVWEVVSRIITATSPNWRSASTSTTGRSDRWASTTARLVATTLLPDPPLGDETVITRPRSGSWPAVGGGVATTLSVRTTRSTDSWRAWASVGDPRTSFTPERSACWRSPVESSDATRMPASSGRAPVSFSISARPGPSDRPGPNTTTTG